MPDMNDLPNAPETQGDQEAVARLREEVEALRLLTAEDNIRYWLSDEAMEND